jgi:hypothetical protein
MVDAEHRPPRVRTVALQIGRDRIRLEIHVAAAPGQDDDAQRVAVQLHREAGSGLVGGRKCDRWVAATAFTALKPIAAAGTFDGPTQSII